DAARGELCGIRSPDIKVLAAVAGRGVDESGAGVVADMVAGKNGNEKIVTHRLQGMDTPGARNRIYVAESLEFGDAGMLEDIGGELVGQHELVAHFRPIALRRIDDLVEPVFDLWRKADGSVAGDRPWRRRPDENRCPVEIILLGVDDRKLHPHLVRDVVL